MRTAAGGWASELESQVCVWARRPPPHPQDGDCTANILELVPRPGHRAKRSAWTPSVLTPHPHNTPVSVGRLRLSQSPSASPGRQTQGRATLPRHRVRPALPWKPPPSTPRGRRADAGVRGGPGAPSAPGRLHPGDAGPRLQGFFS